MLRDGALTAVLVFLCYFGISSFDNAAVFEIDCNEVIFSCDRLHSLEIKDSVELLFAVDRCAVLDVSRVLFIFIVITPLNLFVF